MFSHLIFPNYNMFGYLTRDCRCVCMLVCVHIWEIRNKYWGLYFRIYIILTNLASSQVDQKSICSELWMGGTLVPLI